ncbi:MAG TPA: RecQ family ATP-dependent DNA helicase [Pirellulaceae bacterium]|nr:RecQ family ATP-dependent DNA helicase [Pirellulaceae bacterium]
MSSCDKAVSYLRKALNRPNADFRDGQWESIEQLLKRRRVLVVERTGWGKSMVYFLATRLLRDAGAGPTLLISPLLALMRNQIEAAERINVRAATINSTNKEEWEQVKADIGKNLVDVLLISPERLANEDFGEEILGKIGSNIGMLVVDEAHCISDWGHDFRPDYRRIVRILDALPSNIPVLATTATANNRVVDDVQAQLGEKITVQRGSLVRDSLKLQNINMPSPAARMAWLAEKIPALPGSGIVYALTQRDAERVAEWLKINRIEAQAYHAGLQDEVKNELEQALLDNGLKVLVATVALGMGFDKPDLGFVIHFQRPSSVVHYYQQVGRAGRAVDEAFGILLCGEEDDEIADYFIRSAFPPQQHVGEILDALEQSRLGHSVPELQRILNMREGQIKKALNFLSVESPSPIVKIGSKYQITAAARNYRISQEYVDEIAAIRHDEQQQMQEYMKHRGCLMAFLQQALDDPTADDCGKCMNCDRSQLLEESYSSDLANRAGLFLRRSFQPIVPRKRWPASNMFERSPLSGYNIPDNQRAQEGRALSLWRDAGWGQLVARGKYETEQFSDELVDACVEMLEIWSPQPPPQWVTCVPSQNHPALVPDFAARLADALRLPFVPCVQKVRNNPQQKLMQNSFQQAKNLDGVFQISNNCKAGPCLLVDDVVDSGWTFTVVAALLRRVGCSAVYPLALAMNSPRMD